MKSTKATIKSKLFSLISSNDPCTAINFRGTALLKFAVVSIILLHASLE